MRLRQLFRKVQANAQLRPHFSITLHDSGSELGAPRNRSEAGMQFRVDEEDCNFWDHHCPGWNDSPSTFDYRRAGAKFDVERCSDVFRDLVGNYCNRTVEAL